MLYSDLLYRVFGISRITLALLRPYYRARRKLGFNSKIFELAAINIKVQGLQFSRKVL